MKGKLKIYGSDANLNAFEEQFKAAGFTKLNYDPVLSKGIPIAPSINYLIVSGIGSCIKTILLSRHLRMVGPRGKDEERIVIQGDLSADEIERLIERSRHFDIRNEAGE